MRIHLRNDQQSLTSEISDVPSNDMIRYTSLVQIGITTHLTMLFFSPKQLTVDSHLIGGVGKLKIGDTDNSPGTAEPASTTAWKPDFFRPWPLKEGEDMPTAPWARPEQIPMSFVGMSLSCGK